MQNPILGIPGQVAARSDGLASAVPAITAAMLKAAKGNCTCEVCQIMRGVIDKVADGILAEKTPPASGG